MKEELMMSVSGVRGIVGKSLTPSLLIRLAQAFGTLVGPGTVVVGRDTRLSGEMVKHAVFSGLISSGCEVIDIEICPTPTIQLMAKELKAKGGLAITASHNPIEWNALKFISSTGMFLNEKQAKKLFKIFNENSFRQVSWDGLKVGMTYPLAVRAHLKKIMDFLDVEKIRKKSFKVVVDCCNGAGSVISPALLRELGCFVVEVNTNTDGFFPRPPEPIPQNLGVLCSVVKATGSDIGFAHDSDADRLSIVSEKGIAVGEEMTLELAADYVLSKKKGIVVTNLSTSMAIDDIVKRHSGRLIRTKVGEINVTTQAKKYKAVIAGEGNGGVINPRIHYGRDGIATLGLILEYMASENKSISQLISRIPVYHIEKKKIQVARENIAPTIENIKNEYKDKKIDCTDGIKILMDHAWIHFRASGTEPVIRVIAEAKTKSQAEKLCNDGMKLVKKISQ